MSLHTLAKIEGVIGAQFLKSDAGYAGAREQYATSSEGGLNNMNPGLIVNAASIDDITRTVKYAATNGFAIAIRTGGHQYSGASSTGPNGIQLDVSKTFRADSDRSFFSTADKTFLRTSVSWSLGEFNAYLAQHQVFVPTGQCAYVNLGGHAQTGGYGQLARSFGLLGDHITSLEYVDHRGEPVEINKKANPDLFYAWVGGSPGNFGVLTHFTLEVHRDSNYEGSWGMRSLYLYSYPELKRLLNILVTMSEDKSFPRNYDLSISVLSSAWKPAGFSGLAQILEDKHPDIFVGDPTDGLPLSIIMVYAQWVKLSPTDKPNEDWFNLFKKGAVHVDLLNNKPMSEIVKLWLFHSKREFDMPYVKRTLVTNSNTLSTDGWAEWVAGRIDEICTPWNGLFVSAQLQCFGGDNSMFRKNANNGTSYSWRDSTVGYTIDCFHKDDTAHRERAEGWEKVNDQEGVGPQGKFSKTDKRLLWGSWGDFNLNDVRGAYYDSEEKYRKIQKQRAVADPKGTFTPNTFCVKAAGSK